MRRLSPDTVLCLDAGRPAARRWVAPRWWRPALRAAKVGAALVLGAGVPAWAWHSGVVAGAAETAVAEALALSGAAGLRVQEVLVEGRTNTRPEELRAALRLQRGDPILGFDLAAAKERIEALPWVGDVALERRLPGTITLRLREREPVALWQNQGAFILVDAEGTPIPDAVGAYLHLPQIVGEDAAQHAGKLLEMLAGEPALAARVKAAVRVSGRRWDLVMDDLRTGIRVRLPETDPTTAWRRLARLEREQGLLGRDIGMVDLRLPDRLVVRRGEGQGTGPGDDTPARPPAGKEA